MMFTSVWIVGMKAYRLLKVGEIIEKNDESNARYNYDGSIISYNEDEWRKRTDMFGVLGANIGEKYGDRHFLTRRLVQNPKRVQKQMPKICPHIEDLK